MQNSLFSEQDFRQYVAAVLRVSMPRGQAWYEASCAQGVEFHSLEVQDSVPRASHLELAYHTAGACRSAYRHLAS